MPENFQAQATSSNPQEPQANQIAQPAQPARDWSDLPAIIKDAVERHRAVLARHKQVRSDFEQGVKFRKEQLAAMSDTSAAEKLDQRAHGWPLVQNDSLQVENLKALDSVCGQLRSAISEEEALNKRKRLMEGAQSSERSASLSEHAKAETTENERLQAELQKLSEEDAQAKKTAAIVEEKNHVGVVGLAGLVLLVVLAIAGAWKIGLVAAILLWVIAGYLMTMQEKSAKIAKKLLETETARLNEESRRRMEALRVDASQQLAAMDAEHAEVMRDLRAKIDRAHSNTGEKRRAVLPVFERVAQRAKIFAAQCDLKPQAQTDAESETEKAIADSKAEWEKTWHALPPYLRGEWPDGGEPEGSFWKKPFEPQPATLPFFADGILSDGGGADAFQMPHLNVFMAGPAHEGRFVQMNTRGKKEDGESLLRTIVLQLALIHGKRAQFTFLAPPGEGLFPMQGVFRSLGLMRKPARAGDVSLRSALKEIIGDMDRIANDILHGESFEAARAKGRGAEERHEFVFAANFPWGYSNEECNDLVKIAGAGPRTGKYLFLHLSQKLQLDDKHGPPEGMWDSLHKLNPFILNLPKPPKFGKTDFPWDEGVEKCSANWLGTPRVLSAVLDSLKREAPKPVVKEEPKKPEAAPQPPPLKPRPLPAWETLQMPDGIWTEKAGQKVEAVVGYDAENNPLTVWFDSENCAHGILAGNPGSGKSTFFQLFLTSLALRYSPEEVNFYLIDGKQGASLGILRGIPHTRAIAMRAPAELMRNVLAEVKDEMDKRNNALTEAGVTSITKYWEKVPDGRRRFPIIILLIDEYGVLYQGNDADAIGDAADNLGLLARQGRSAGIRLFLGSQFSGDLKGGRLTKAEQILGNIHLRAAMRMGAGTYVQEVDREGRDLAKKLTEQGQILLNDHGGADGFNRFGKVLHVDEEKMKAALQSVADKAKTAGFAVKPLVFNGNTPPLFIENSQLAALLAEPEQPGANRMEEIALKPENEGGFGIDTWAAGMGSMIFWAGQQLKIGKQAQVMLMRNPGENIFILGNGPHIAHGILAAFLCAGALNKARIFVSENTPPRNAWSDLLKTCVEQLSSATGRADMHHATPDRAGTTALLDQWGAELSRRAQLADAGAEQPWILFISEADRLQFIFRELNPKYNAYEDTETSRKLDLILDKGPALGMHVVMTASRWGQKPQLSVFDKKMACFNHRLLIPGIDDASCQNFMGWNRAPVFQTDSDEKSACVFYKNMENPALGGKFRPYRTERTGRPVEWETQFSTIAAKLAAWTKGEK